MTVAVTEFEDLDAPGARFHSIAERTGTGTLGTSARW